MFKKKFHDISCLVVGLGSIGTRHAHNLKKLKIKNISLFDQDYKKAKKVGKSLDAETYSSFQTALSNKPDLCLICTYPNTHIDIAKKCIENNSNIFIEKPLSTTTLGIQSLISNAMKKNLKIGVGHNLRFDPGLIYLKNQIQLKSIGNILSISVQMGNHIKNWRPGTNYKNHYILKTDGGIILDDSHEYDYLRWLLNDEVQSVYCQTNSLKTLKTKSESLATIILRFRKGTIATLLMDHVRPSYERNCFVIGDKGSIKWENFNFNSSSWNTYNSRSRSIVKTIKINGNVDSKSFNFYTNDPYISEIKEFFNSIIDNNKNQNGIDAFKTLKIGIAALNSSNKNKIIKL